MDVFPNHWTFEGPIFRGLIFLVDVFTECRLYCSVKRRLCIRYDTIEEFNVDSKAEYIHTA